MEKERRQKVIVKICCIIAAFILWVYVFNVENPVQTRKILNVPVEIANSDSLIQSKLLLLDQKYTINLTIKGATKDIYSVSPNDFKIIVDLSGYALIKGSNKVPVKIIQKPENVTVINSNFLWVNLLVDDYQEKNVKIEAEISEKSSKGFLTVGSIVKPSTVIVSGGSQNVDLVARVIAKGNVENINQNVTLNVPLQAVDVSGKPVKGVDIQPNSAEVTIIVGKSKSVPIKLKTIGELPKGFSYKDIVLEKSKVDIYSENQKLSNIREIQTNPIDLSTVSEGNNVIEASLAIPDGIKLINPSDKKVKITFNHNKEITKTLSCNIKAINANATYNIELERNTVELNLSGLESIITALKPEDIKCNVDCSKLKEGNNSVPINVKIPSNIKLISKSISNVNVKVSKKTADNKEANNNNGADNTHGN